MLPLSKPGMSSKRSGGSGRRREDDEFEDWDKNGDEAEGANLGEHLLTMAGGRNDRQGSTAFEKRAIGSVNVLVDSYRVSKQPSWEREQTHQSLSTEELRTGPKSYERTVRRGTVRRIDAQLGGPSAQTLMTSSRGRATPGRPLHRESAKAQMWQRLHLAIAI